MIERDVLGATRAFARENKLRSWIAVLSTMVLLKACAFGALFVHFVPVRLAFAILEGLLLVRGFILFHDFQHNAILRGSKIARALFWVFGLYVMTPPRVWRETHNYHHANNSKIVGSHIGSYPIVTVAMWAHLTKAQRLAYRVARHPLTIVFGYLTVFAWGMCLGPFLRAPKKNASALGALVLQVALAVATIRWLGVAAWAFGIIGPQALAMALGSYLFYAQHNFAGMQLRPRERWTYVTAALESSSYMPMGALGRFFTGNIGYHHVHHLNPGIPFYRLPEAMAEIEELQSPTETRLRWTNIVASFRGAVWDPDEARMVPVASLGTQQPREEADHAAV